MRRPSGVRLVGIVTEHDLLGRLVEGCATLSSAVAEVMFRSVNTVHRDQDAGCLLEIFARNEIGLVGYRVRSSISLTTNRDPFDTRSPQLDLSERRGSSYVRPICA